jgi:hypothetical protein
MGAVVAVGLIIRMRAYVLELTNSVLCLRSSRVSQSI